MDDTFDVCWSCGTATDGTEDPEFVSDSAPGSGALNHITPSVPGWADFALTIGQFCAVIGCLASLWAFVGFRWRSDLARLIFVPLAFFYQLAMFVVFSRVKKL